ncbi:MAG: hypothetical protein KJZ83_16785 [Burkholderiaceae bacterium]|nr:hypothetical protein [Burkholderiaceae bacterium]
MVQETNEFTIERYRAILVRAGSLGYRIGPFRAFDGARDRPALLLRHDLDHAIEPALRIARLEADLGVASTFFVQTACAFYNLLADEERARIATIVELGHEIGLHYVSARYTGAKGSEHLRADIALLEDLSGQPVTAAAQHVPTDGEPVSLEPEIAIEAYQPRFTEHPMSYLSDSLMAWRDTRPEELLDARASFQFLTHPENWTEGANGIGAVLDSLKRAALDATERRYEEVAAYYQRLLAERAERDRLFRARRGLPPRR